MTDEGSTPSEKNEDIRRQFGAASESYVTSKIHSSPEDLEYCLKLISPQKDWKAIDIATGTGHLALALAPHLESIIGFDLTEEMLEQSLKVAKNRSIENYAVKQGDVHNIPYPEYTFDLVSVRIAPHHFHDIDKAIGEMTRVLKQGGYLFIEDTIATEDEIQARIFNEIERWRDSSHIRDLPASEWVELLEKNGLKVLETEKRGKKWPLRWWTERMNTPEERVKKVLDLLHSYYQIFTDDLTIVHEKRDNPLDSWTILPNNGYFLGKKL